MQGPPIEPGYVPYPRQFGPGASGPAPRRVRLDALTESWNVIKPDLGVWVGVALVILGVQLVIELPMIIYTVMRVFASLNAGANSSEVGQMTSDFFGVTAGTVVLVHFVAGVLTTGGLRFALLHVRQASVSFGDMFRFNGMFGQVLLA